MQSLVNFPLLELLYDFHILFADGIVLEIIEFGRIVAEIQQIDFSLVFSIELLYELPDIEIIACLLDMYLFWLAILSPISFWE